MQGIITFKKKMAIFFYTDIHILYLLLLYLQFISNKTKK